MNVNDLDTSGLISDVVMVSTESKVGYKISMPPGNENTCYAMAVLVLLCTIPELRPVFCDPSITRSKE